GKPGQWYRPGPEFEARALGRWPSHGSGVWSDALWEKCLQGEPPSYPLDTLPQIGCDCATGKGDDFHAIHARWGAVSRHHEPANTTTPGPFFERLVKVAEAMPNLVNRHRHASFTPCKPERIPIVLDDDGTGNAIADFLQAEGFNVHLLSAASLP